MKKMYRRAAGILLGIVFVFGAARIVMQLMDYRRGEEIYTNAQHLAFPSAPEETQKPDQSAVTPEETQQPVHPTVIPGETVPEETRPTQPPEVIPEPVQLLRRVELDALKLVNPDVLGWIYIPDTVVSYPLMQTTQRDEYLYKAWDGSENSGGSIFLEMRNRRDLSDFNTIIYGHLMGNGSMFGSLKNYADPQYLQSHPYVYVATGGEVRRYQVFAAYEASVDSDTYRLYFEDDTRRQAALDGYLQHRADVDIVPTVTDRILTLSTCMGTGRYETRWVVQWVCTGVWET